MKNQQISFLDEYWKEEWQGMPEFVQENLSPEYQLLVNFSCYEDLQKFSALVGQRLTSKTRSIWYPSAKIDRYANKRYIRES